MSATNRGAKNDAMQEMMKKQKVLEINPRSPLIEGLLHRVEQLEVDGVVRDEDLEAELQEVAAILIDGALVRSGFDVADSNLWVLPDDILLLTDKPAHQVPDSGGSCPETVVRCVGDCTNRHYCEASAAC